jgi:hypothetical protein
MLPKSSCLGTCALVVGPDTLGIMAGGKEDARTGCILVYIVQVSVQILAPQLYLDVFVEEDAHSTLTQDLGHLPNVGAIFSRK